MTKALIYLATKGSIEQLHNMDRDAGKIYYHHGDCWGATVTIAVGTAEEPGEYYEGDTFTPKSDYKWTVSPNIDQ
ncbi:hypothetical protein WALSEDRAFT_61620 [Wallemia mellicola CBS 633.66]|uniref:Uncharacterized protein n=1 Tax=Wallemia mellicola (strain ATCC MYA-4683 / CBS 633.66) TaxID=671144 RepID=I4Y5B2_WALMC|nr:hypothetical protein WALSEDRAFT_61620 [Wallemia mellicola CBS 633.66]EIM19154.1 hypothetical protein WALSEDRAFT_61620 [Wallemia mellicola CBS 633.66]|eukprot:XP_006960816.1 hypothetical protein WALSEDRAFT_61620 [Wallemia mellicola CBS 633.66]